MLESWLFGWFLSLFCDAITSAHAYHHPLYLKVEQKQMLWPGKMHTYKVQIQRITLKQQLLYVSYEVLAILVDN